MRPELEAEQEVDFGRYGRRIAHRWWLVLAAAGVGVLVGWLVSLGGGDVYKATATIYLGQPLVAERNRADPEPRHESLGRARDRQEPRGRARRRRGGGGETREAEAGDLDQDRFRREHEVGSEPARRGHGSWPLAGGERRGREPPGRGRRRSRLGFVHGRKDQDARGPAGRAGARARDPGAADRRAAGGRCQP